MKPHRFDPLSFVAGIVFALLGAILLWGRVDLHDLRPSALWAWPILAAGLLFTLYGGRRLLDERAAGQREGRADGQTVDPDESGIRSGP
jgi:hypothetical protein